MLNNQGFYLLFWRLYKVGGMLWFFMVLIKFLRKKKKRGIKIGRFSFWKEVQGMSITRDILTTLFLSKVYTGKRKIYSVYCEYGLLLLVLSLS